MKMDPVAEARRATLFLIGGALRPFMPYFKLFSAHVQELVRALLMTYLLKDEAADALVPLTPGPDDEDVPV